MRSLLRRMSLWSIAGLLVAGASGCSRPEPVTTPATFSIPDVSIKSVSVAIPVTITYDTGAKKCVVSYKKTPVYAAPDQVLMWAVSNECSGPENKGIDVTGFRIQFDNTDPTIHGNLQRDIKYLDTKLMIAVVKGKGQVTNGTTYPYHFYIGADQQADPDVIIEFETLIMLPARTEPVKR